MIRLNSAVALVCLCVSATTFALPEDREKPITGVANKTTFDANAGKSIFTGNVRISQGLLTIYADEVVFERDEETGDLTYLLATGNPVRFIDTPSATEPPIEVRGSKIEFYQLENRIITTGSASLTQEDNQAVGERIEYNTVSGVMTIESAIVVNGDTDAEQATFVLQPGKND